MKTLTEIPALNDAQLVELCLTGNRDAFGRVVARYQSLICGIAYSACGDVGRSEDLAQDTFIAAWKDLRALKEPGKLKSWLCGIIRNLVHNSHRRESRTPTAQADLLDGELACAGAGPDEQAMCKEEEAIVWRALETIPSGYREPMVLFYREGRSTQAVAAALDLTEEAVRQRLSRGRVMLNESVVQTVESALTRSIPGKGFTIAVLAALPGLGISAKAATLGATAASGSATAKAAASAGWLGALLGPVLSFLGIWVGYRVDVGAAHPGRERAFVKRFYRVLASCLAGFAVIYFVLMCFAQPLMKAHAALFAAMLIALALTYTAAIAVLTLWSLRQRRELLATMTEDEAAADLTKPVWEYRSKIHFLGLPLVHIRVSAHVSPPIKAWIAMGDNACGGLFAFGGFAIAPVSVGGCAIGLFSFGGLSIGALALGGLVLGVWSFGGMAFGWQAFGGCALAWDAAFGGVAMAHDFALGGLAQAAQANNDAAAQHLEACTFIRGSRMVVPYLAWMNLVWFLPMLAWWRTIARRSKRAATLILAGSFAMVAMHDSTAQETGVDPLLAKPAVSEASSYDKFDELVRDDFFAGILENDRVAFDRAMKVCADALAKDPKHAPAMVWQGTGLMQESAKAFQGKDIPKGLDLWQRGLKTMDDAVALAPDSVSVLIPRGSVLLPMSRYDPNPEESRALLKTGVADYEKVLKLQTAYFATLSVHAQGELLSGLADGWFRLGEMDKSRDYLRRMVKDLPGSDYATRAADWLQTTDKGMLQKKSAAMSCIGCHGP